MDISLKIKKINKNNFKQYQSSEKLLERYKSLVKEAQSSGDKIMLENYLQHVDHFTRIISEKNLNGNISVALRPEKININKKKSENNINAKVTNASFVGSNYQYILSTNIGKIYVVSNDTTNIHNVDDEVFLSFDEKEVKILKD